jgi:hypothetical protein
MIPKDNSPKVRDFGHLLHFVGRSTLVRFSIHRHPAGIHASKPVMRPIDNSPKIRDFGQRGQNNEFRCPLTMHSNKAYLCKKKILI